MPPFLRENAAALGISGAAVGGLLYVLLGVLANWVYEPASVTAAEVGLGYAPLLLGTAQALVFVLSAALVVVGLMSALVWLSRKLGAWWWLAIPVAVGLVAFATTLGIPFYDDSPELWLLSAVLLIAAILVGHLASTAWLKVGAAVVVIGVIGVTGGFIRDAANSARNDLWEGYANPPGLWTQPWSSRVVIVRSAESHERVPRLPRCVLYLGEANGTSVFYAASPDDDDGRTFRLPASSVRVEILGDEIRTDGLFGGPCAQPGEQQ